MRTMKWFAPVYLLALLLFFGFSSQAMAAATLTVATGGSAIPSNTVGGAWTTLTGPVVAEGSTGDIGTGTIVLTVPGGFEFDTTAAPTVLITRTSGSGADTRNINDLASGTAVVTTVTSTTITFTVTASSSNGVKNSLTWQNIHVRPTAETPLASGNIVRSGTSIISGVTATNWGALQEVNPLPTTTSISPASKNVDDPGFTMTVNGTNFVSGSVVQFAGSARTTTYVSATQLTATIPASDMLAAGTFNITVFNPTPGGGTSNAQTFTVNTVNNPVPTTTSISPTSKTLGAAMFTLTVNGTNFVSGSVVRFAGSDRATTYVSPTQLTATIPATDLTTVGTFPITVFNPTPGGGTSNAQTFTVNPAAPSATTNAATGVTAWAATLNGTVSSNGADTTVSFDYGLTTAYGSSIAATPSPLGAVAVNTAVSAALAGLNCNTTFHYRVVATNSAGTTNGLDGTFNTGACGAPYPATACAATRFGTDLGCTANDVNITGITLVAGSTSPSCVSGTPVTLDLDLTVNFASPDRWDVGIFIANDGKLPTLLPANGGASSCSVGILPTTPPFLDLDGVPQGTLDTCGDGNGSIDDSALPGGTVPLGDGVKRMTGVTLPCYASATSGGQLFVPFAVSWDNQKSPTGSLCTSNLDPVPNTTSKCNAPASSVSIAVVVLPVITKTNGGTEINPGTNTTYTVVINNNSGGTLLDMVFTDPVVPPNLTVNSVSCAAASGATCPTTSVAAMQGAGISIPSASLPNNSSLTFTINATVSPDAGIGSHIINTATVTLTGGGSTSASDDDTVVLAPSAAMSFAPSTITEGAASVLTITLTNPTASDLTGVWFTDIYPAGMVNTAAASGATTCSGGTVTAANDGNSLALSGGTIPASGSCTVTVNVTSATAGSYPNSTGTVTHATGTISAASATLTVNVAVYGGFNACDSAAAPNATCTNTTTPATSHIATKIAGSPFTLDLVALKTDGTRQTTYNNNVVVELLDASDNSGALDAYNCRSTWTTVLATLTPAAAFSSGLLSNVGPFTVANAYSEVRVRVTNSGGTTKKGCSTDNFAIRPNSLEVIPTDDTWETAMGTRTINNTDATSPGCSAVNIPIGCTGTIHKAGQPFTVTATAKNVSNVTTANYNVTVAPTAALSACSPGNACTASFGTLALGTPAFSAGVVAWNSATYSEVGAFNLTLQDTGFASVDAADTAATCAGYYVCSAATAVGRFVPDHFDTAVEPTATIPMPCPTGLIPGCPYDSFVYSGQPFSLTVTAKNASGDPTINYNTATGLAKTTNLTAWGELGTTTVPTGAGALGVASVTAFAAGTLTETVEKYTFTATLTAPTDVYVRATEASGGDGVTSQHAVAASSIEGGVKVVSGRIKLSNAHGSELLPLPLTATVQYYNGTNWLTSTTDSVTSLTPGLSNYQCKTGCAWTTTPTPASGSVNLGVLPFRLSAPTGGGTGSVDVNSTAPSYLPSNAARATFGVYKGANEFIYMREDY